MTRVYQLTAYSPIVGVEPREGQFGTYWRGEYPTLEAAQAAAAPLPRMASPRGTRIWSYEPGLNYGGEVERVRASR